MTNQTDVEPSTGVTDGGQAPSNWTACVCRLVLSGNLDEAWDTLETCVRHLEVHGTSEQRRFFVRGVLDRLVGAVPAGESAAGGFILCIAATYGHMAHTDV